MPIRFALSAENPADAVYVVSCSRAMVTISRNKKLFLIPRVMSSFFFFASSSNGNITIAIHSSIDTEYY